MPWNEDGTRKKSATPYAPFKMQGHTLPGINQRIDDNAKKGAAEGLAGSSALQYNSPAKDKSRDWAALHAKASKEGSGATKEQIASLKKKADTQKSAQEYVIKEGEGTTKEGIETIKRFQSGEQTHTT